MKEFQFHYGTIKSSTVADTGIITPYFNSTMVRLKAQAAGATMNPTQLFQFHYGTIKRVTSSKAASVPEDFNSTMVRLKV